MSGQPVFPPAPNNNALPAGYLENVGDLAPGGMPNDLLNAGDLVVLTQLVTGVITPTALELALADINGDSLINGADLLMLQQALIAP